jgi:hypothetical protein
MYIRTRRLFSPVTYHKKEQSPLLEYLRSHTIRGILIVAEQMASSTANGSQRASRIRNCAWGYRCDKTWDGLITTAESNIRFYDSCDKQVYLCRTGQELADSVLLNRCVAFPPKLLSRTDTEGSRRHGHRQGSDDEPGADRVFLVGDVIVEYRIETSHD